MKHPFFLLGLLAASALGHVSAHEHIEIGFDNTRSRLAAYGNTAQVVTYFPEGEAPSANLPLFPGGTFATVLTFSAFDIIDTPPGNVFVRVRLLSVSGPSGGGFSFWEAGATVPTWTRPSGWSAVPDDQPSISVSEDSEGYGHIHGRVFGFTMAGEYDVTFQAVDALGNYAAGSPFVVRFTVIQAPQLTIRVQGSNIQLTFTGRENLIYDLQSSPTLAPGSWTTIDTLDGTGSLVEWSEPLGNRSRVFYRLVEYR